MKVQLNGKSCELDLMNGLVKDFLYEALLMLQVTIRPGDRFRFKLKPQDGRPNIILNNNHFLSATSVRRGDTLEILCVSGDSPENPATPSNSDFITMCVDSRFLKNPDDYTIQAAVAFGRFGEVLTGFRNTSPGRKLAFKKVWIFGKGAELNFIRFLRDVHIMASVNHPAVMNLSGIIPATEPNAQPHLIMQMMEGSLSNIVRQESGFARWITITKKYIMLYGAAQAMKEMHFMGITHGSLKPANVLFDQNGFPFVADFGYANVSLEGILEKRRTVIPQFYIAPEVARDGKRISQSADVWSFGLLMWATLANGEPWVDRKTNTPLYDRIPALLAESKLQGTMYLKKLVQACLNIQPEKRPSFAEIVSQMETPMCNEGVDTNEFQKYLNKFHLREAHVVKVDQTSSEVAALRAAMKRRDANAAIRLGEFYECGYGQTEDVDFSQAVACYRKAAEWDESGYADLARCYKYGIGVEKDTVVAKILEEKAAPKKSK